MTFLRKNYLYLFNILAKSTKQFDTKHLLFETPHSNPKMIAMSDLKYLKDTQMDGLFESSKLKAPKNYEFQDIALAKERINLDIPTEPEFKDQTEMGSDDESDAKLTFNQSLSYIHLLRLDTPSDQKSMNSTEKQIFNSFQQAQ